MKQSTIWYSKKCPHARIDKPTEEVNIEIAKWVKYTNKLNKYGVELLKLSERVLVRSGSQRLRLISKYQCIDEEKMQQAIAILQ